jgi:hypothetical protein
MIKSTKFLFVWAGLIALLTACVAQRRVASGNTTVNGGTNSVSNTPVTCFVSVNPSPAMLTVGTDGEIVSGNRNVSFGVALSRSAQVVSVDVERPAGLQVSSSFAIPSAFQSQFTIQAQLLDGRENAAVISVRDTDSNLVSCLRAPVTISSTVQATRPTNPVSASFSGRFDGDAIDDSVALESVTGFLWVTLGGSSPAVVRNWGTFSPSVNWSNITAVNTNGDAFMDLVARDPVTGAWWAARSNGSGFTNVYLGTWNASTSWTNIVFGTNALGIATVTGTDGNGYRWTMALNGNASNPSTPSFVPPSVSISVAAAPSDVGAATLSVGYNASVYVSWSSTNTQQCDIYKGPDTAKVSIGSGSNSSSPLLLGPLTANTRVSIGCRAPDNSIITPVSAQITVAPPAQPTVTLTSSASVVAPNGRVNLTFSSTNVTSCSLKQGNVTLSTLPSGVFQSSDIAADTDFRFECTSAAGPAVRTVTVKLTSLMSSSPTMLEFSSVNVGVTSAAQTLVLKSLRNRSTAIALTVPAGFIREGGTCSSAATFVLEKDATCTLAMKFKPGGAGAIAPNLRVAYNNGVSASTFINVALKGTGVKKKKGK